MNFLILGLNHKSAPLQIREKVSFRPADIFNGLRFLQGYPYIKESLILSTCNRVELYALSENKEEGLKSLKEFLYIYHELKRLSLDEYFYVYENQEAIRHLFRVVSSLDSMMVGENQILYQVKQAYLSAQNCGSTGKFLSSIFQETLRVGKRIRTETNISKGVVSISSAAVELAKKILKDLSGKKILIIGAGKIGELTTKALADRGIELILVANRTYEKAIKLAKVFQGKAIQFSEINKILCEVDIVISSTSAPHYILRKKDIIPIINKRKDKFLFLIDLGVPRNIEQSISEIDNVYLYNIDDLHKISETNLQERLKEAYKAEEIIIKETGSFYHKFRELAIPISKSVCLVEP